MNPELKQILDDGADWIESEGVYVSRRTGKRFPLKHSSQKSAAAERACQAVADVFHDIAICNIEPVATKDAYARLSDSVKESFDNLDRDVEEAFARLR